MPFPVSWRGVFFFSPTVVSWPCLCQLDSILISNSNPHPGMKPLCSLSLNVAKRADTRNPGLRLLGLIGRLYTLTCTHLHTQTTHSTWVHSQDWIIGGVLWRCQKKEEIWNMENTEHLLTIEFTQQIFIEPVNSKYSLVQSCSSVNLIRNNHPMKSSLLDWKSQLAKRVTFPHFFFSILCIHS